MNIKNIITGVCSILFLMIGADKFLNFLEPPCSMMNSISSIVWQFLGVLQIAAGILIWLPKFKKSIAIFFTIFMLVFTIVHLINGTYDIGGSMSMAVLLGILAWDPAFIRGKKK